MRTFTISEPDLRRLRGLLFTPDNNENAVFALCGYSLRRGVEVLYTRHIIPIPGDGYLARTPVHLEVAPRFINEVLDLAQNRLAVVVAHSHPGGLTTQFSTSDDYGETRLMGVFADLIPNAPHSSLLFSDEGIIGRYWDGRRFLPMPPIRVVGPTLQFGSRLSPTPPRPKRATGRGTENGVHARQVLAFGEDTQRRLEATRVGIVGLGGTGSCVAEQLVRLGVEEVLLVDPDRFEPSNLTRVYGSVAADLKKGPLKTEIARRNLRAINPGLKVATESSSVISRRTISRLVDQDVVFCCTDNEASRAVLNRFSYQYYTPVIDIGTRIVAENDIIIGAAGRVTLIAPGLPCLWCGFHLDATRIRNEVMEPGERAKLVAQGYVEGLDVTGPSVISVNSTVASMSCTMLIGMLTPFSQVPQSSPEQVYDAIDGTVFRVSAESSPECHVCGRRGVTGLGDLEPVTTYP
jgi:molybdopterin/thiamine biosynthesis adenylyltransferase